ncbi:MAG: GNAT family N-acetyltransferase [Spirochaetaceae bacterium]|jgi:ribosomal protein S18 acetylase RimI-like enzyme|nr:GNAT family N-acetyltransferase [Spirochaetaceae bacterium]
MEFREVKDAGEIELLLGLIQEIWPEVFTPLIGKEQVDYMLVHYQGKDAIAKDIEQGIRYFLVEHDGGHIGYFAYSLEDDRLFISKIYLKKSCRGLGLSSKIFRYFEDLARNNQKEKMFLHVNRNNRKAVEVYLHRGFEIVKTVDEPLGEKFFLNDYWMEKKVAAPCPGLQPRP